MLLGLSGRELRDSRPPQLAQASIERVRNLLWHGRSAQADQELACFVYHSQKIAFRGGDPERSMSKAFIAEVIQGSTECKMVAANRAAGDLIAAIVKELKQTVGFILPSFGTFAVRKTKARKGLNPRTDESIKVKAGKTVRFKASPVSKKSV
jgi:DNA-binding protein HU-beta